MQEMAVRGDYLHDVGTVFKKRAKTLLTFAQGKIVFDPLRYVTENAGHRHSLAVFKGSLAASFNRDSATVFREKYGFVAVNPLAVEEGVAPGLVDIGKVPLRGNTVNKIGAVVKQAGVGEGTISHLNP